DDGRLPRVRHGRFPRRERIPQGLRRGRTAHLQGAVGLQQGDDGAAHLEAVHVQPPSGSFAARRAHAHAHLPRGGGRDRPRRRGQAVRGRAAPRCARSGAERWAPARIRSPGGHQRPDCEIRPRGLIDEPEGDCMFIGYFTERPYQDRQSGYFGHAGRDVTDLSMSNGSYDPVLGSDLYNRYLDEKVYAEEMGFDGLMLNEHHSTPFCMGGAMNIEAAILARITRRAKIVLLGNILPIWDDPLWLAEMLAEIDMISRGRLVSGWVRGTGRESVSHNAQPPFNWERFHAAHTFVLTA